MSAVADYHACDVQSGDHQIIRYVRGYCLGESGLGAGGKTRKNCVGWRIRSRSEPTQLPKGVSLRYQALVSAIETGAIPMSALYEVAESGEEDLVLGEE